jgi:uncharacterized damage-inducible protein DinB
MVEAPHVSIEGAGAVRLTGRAPGANVGSDMARPAGSIGAWRRQAIRRMQGVRRTTLALVARLPESEIVRSRTQDRWSVKDVLGHLLACDEETVRRFRLIARGRGDRIHWFESMADADRFNARAVARLRRYGLAALLRRMARVHEQLVGAFRRLPAAALRDPAHAYTVVEWLPAPGWSHEQDHLREVRQWWRARRRELARR